MRWLLVLALLLPLAVVGVASAHVADAAGRALGARLDGVASAMLTPRREPLPFALLPDEAPAAETVVLAATAKRSKKKPVVRAEAPRTVFISAPVVLRLAHRGVRPQGVPVKATGTRPAGLLLTGVGALGVGLRDGDVLTRAAGVPALDVASVIHAVLAARGRGARTISGRFWRSGQEWVLVVEQPYPSAEPGRVSVDERAQPGRKRGV